MLLRHSSSSRLLGRLYFVFLCLSYLQSVLSVSHFTSCLSSLCDPESSIYLPSFLILFGISALWLPLSLELHCCSRLRSMIYSASFYRNIFSFFSNFFFVHDKIVHHSLSCRKTDTTKKCSRRFFVFNEYRT